MACEQNLSFQKVKFDVGVPVLHIFQKLTNLHLCPLMLVLTNGATISWLVNKTNHFKK